MLNNQQVFNKVCNHLMQQNAKAEVPTLPLGTECRYRTEQGLSCAAGCLILDDLYSSTFEGVSLDVIKDEWSSDEANEKIEMLKNVLMLSGVSSDSFPLVRRLQDTHDTYEPEEWVGKLDIVAQDYKLTLPQSVKDKLS